MNTKLPKLLVLNRIEMMRRFARLGSLERREPAIGLTHSQVFHAYSGFDGDFWPESGEHEIRLTDGLAGCDQLSVVVEYFRNIRVKDEVDLVMLEFGPTPNGTRPDGAWTFVGYDLGFIESEWSHFSIILNEIIYGHLRELREFAEGLNEHLLIATESQAELILDRRGLLSSAGADVENGENMQAIAVYVRSSP